MEFLYDWGLFAVKSLTLVFFLVFILSFTGNLAKDLSESKNQSTKVRFTDLRKALVRRRDKTRKAIIEADASLSEKERKKSLKALEKSIKSDDEKKALEERIKQASSKGEFCPDRLFVVDFKGDSAASCQKDFIEKINIILDVADQNDELVVNLESPGGVVNGYGLCASALERVRNRGIRLTVCVDNVAASGGYLMACVADSIVAAPFSYVGSIGVIAQLPNFNKVLKKHDVEYEQITAGKYKRTLTMFGENTPEGRDKFKQELVMIHDRFKEIVSRYRPNMDVEQFATGEYWLASDAKERGLVDHIDTFDAYLQNRIDITKVCAIKISIEHVEKKSLKARIFKFFKAKTWTGAIKKEFQEVVNKDLSGRF
ncbi:MAG: protease SohB [Succinivibrio sp.]